LSGDSVDTPQVANFVEPQQILTVNGMAVDMARFIEASERLGVGKGDVVSIGGHRNAKNQWVPDYDTVRIERRASDGEADYDGGG